MNLFSGSKRGEYGFADRWWVYWRPDKIEWVQCASRAQDLPKRGSCTQLADLPAPPGTHLLLCVSGERVRVHAVAVPARKRKQFMAALPYALEETLLREPEDYHLVPLGFAGRHGRSPVAVIEHAQMQAWLDAMASRNWIVDILVPDYLVPGVDAVDTWLLDATEQPMLLRRSDEQIGAVLSGTAGCQLPGALLLALESATTRPARLRVRVADSAAESRVSAWQTALTAMDIALELSIDKRGRADWLSSLPVPQPGHNLLTGPYRPQRHDSLAPGRLVPALTMVLLIATILAAQWFIDLARLKKQHSLVQDDIVATYREAFPEARNIVDPRFQMQQNLEALRRTGREGASRDDDFLEWLERLAPALAGKGDLQLRGLDFDGSSLTVDLSVPDHQALEEIQKRLALQSAIEVQNAELEDGRVNGRLVMRQAL